MRDQGMRQGKRLSYITSLLHDPLKFFILGTSALGALCEGQGPGSTPVERLAVRRREIHHKEFRDA